MYIKEKMGRCRSNLDKSCHNETYFAIKTELEYILPQNTRIGSWGKEFLVRRIFWMISSFNWVIYKSSKLKKNLAQLKI